MTIFALLTAFAGGQVFGGSDIELAFPFDLESRQIAVEVRPGLRSTRSLPNAALRQARLGMLANQVVSDENLRALADHGDGLAALKYVRLLVSRHTGQRAHASDIAYYAAIAVGTGRIWPLRDMITAMRLLNPETEPKNRVREYIAVLYAHAWAGNTMALDAVVEFNGDGLLFGAMSDATRAKILAQSKVNGNGRVELRLAIRLMIKSKRPAEETELAKTYLVQASGSDNLAIKATAENLLLLLNAGQE
ncbi:MAG: hypothetical protein L3J36_14425 [Rhodobacteraceae bacterium]|nr:hypothetical protein [Paracoccaceae bacterium]